MVSQSLHSENLLASRNRHLLANHAYIHISRTMTNRGPLLGVLYIHLTFKEKLEMMHELVFQPTNIFILREFFLSHIRHVVIHKLPEHYAGDNVHDNAMGYQAKDTGGWLCWLRFYTGTVALERIETGF